MIFRKWIFSFLISFVVTFFTGFLLWSAFVDFPGNFVKPVLAEINFKIFSASFVPLDDNPTKENNEITQPKEINLSNPVDIENKNFVVMASEENFEDQLDDIQEKLDIIKQKVQVLIDEQNQENQPIEENKDEQKIIDYPKILISEIEVAGGVSEKEEFVELYNPNDQDVDLTGWLLQRKTSGSSSWSTYVSINSFLDKKISKKGYFLISRTGFYKGITDIFTDNPITNDNSFVLKNPNGDISDKLGFGNALDPELVPAINPIAGQSIGRKVLSDNTEQDADNNFSDFELQNLTPKSQNSTYILPPSGIVGVIASGSGSSSVYPKILISEVQISPIDQRFVELYNPNNQDIDLTGWYLQRKTQTANSFSSFVSSTKFSGKIIPASGYFLISRSNIDADIVFDLTLTPNNFLVLKDPDGKISDEINFGEVEDNKSIGRKVLSDNTEQDTDDDLADFELDIPTPKTQNITYVEPTKPTLQGLAITTQANKLIYNVGDSLDISGLIVTGTYSDESTSPITITSENITGFDSSVPATQQPLTITFEEKITTYAVDIVDAVVPPNSQNQLKIITLPQSVLINAASGIFTVESQDISGVISKVLATTYVNLSSSSLTGSFSSKSASECGDDWTKTSITISKGDAHKSFCYKDSVFGTPTITISADGFSSGSQIITILDSQ